MCKTNNHDLAAEVWHIKEPQKLHRRHDQNARDLVGAQHDEPEGPRDADNRVWLRAAGRRSGGLRAGDIDAPEATPSGRRARVQCRLPLQHQRAAWPISFRR
jgi:hypothetical protein